MSKYELGCVSGKLSHELKERDLDSPWARKFLYDMSLILKRSDFELSERQTYFLEELLEKYYYLVD